MSFSDQNLCLLSVVVRELAQICVKSIQMEKMKDACLTIDTKLTCTVPATLFFTSLSYPIVRKSYPIVRVCCSIVRVSYPIVRESYHVFPFIS